MMKKYLIIVLIAVLFSIIIPFSVYFLMLPSAKGKIIKNKPDENTVKVFFHNENSVKVMNMDEYLYGVVAAEMPASFEQEALKAQAVAARSYTLYRMKNPTNEHPDADVCTDFTHCKAYKNEYTEKIQEAVYETSGEIIAYEGEVAMAVFHSQAGGGKTENSEEVWGGKVPYLVSVESKGEEEAPDFYSTVTYSVDEFKKLLVEKYPDIELGDMPDFEISELSEGGSVKNIRIGNKVLSGKEARSIFKLRSSCFKLDFKDNLLVFSVEGYGHGVGMSQYGANEMAKNGYSYVEILKHYYTDTEIGNV